MWKNKNGFFFSSMHYTFSCFPSCMSMILRNIGVEMNDEVFEASWESMQTSKPGRCEDNTMDKNPPSIEDIARNIAATTIDGIECKILGDSGPDSFTQDEVDVIATHLTEYSHAAIIAAPYLSGHAQMIFFTGQYYVHISANPKLEEKDVCFYENINAELMSNGIRITANGQPLCGGDYAVLVNCHDRSFGKS